MRGKMGLFKKREKKDGKQETTEKKRKKERKRRIKRLRAERPWIYWGIVISVAFSVIFSCFYGVFRENAEKSEMYTLEQAESLSWLYQSCYLLYRDLYNVQNETYSDYDDIYLEVKPEYAWLLDEEQLSALEEAEESGEKERLSWEECETVKAELDNLRGYFQGLENRFVSLNSNFDYCITDNNTGKYVTNMSETDLMRAESDPHFQLSFTFDSAGHVTVGDTIYGRNPGSIRRLANEIIRDNALQSLISQTLVSFGKYGTVRTPVNCTVMYTISQENWLSGKGNYSLSYHGVTDENGNVFTYYYAAENYYGMDSNAYIDAGVGGILLLVLFTAALFGCFLPVLGDSRPWNQEKLCSLSFEVLFCLGTIAVSFGGIILMDIIPAVASGSAKTDVAEYLNISADSASLLVGAFNLIILALFFFVGWYFGVCARAIREKGIKGYIKERSLIYRFFPFIKSKLIWAYESVQHLDLTQDAHKTIFRIILINAVILFIISSLWFGGFAVTVIYSVLLYLILRKYVSDLQKKYSILLKATNEIAEGNLNITIEEDLGVFEPFKSQIIQIQSGFRKAVDEEVKSQKMKAELITNVSHDLKTPLTAIITYVNLLKEENITEEQRKEYLDILERKSLRLKSLIEDLFEVSKANSQNITLNRTDVDIMNLIKQVVFELSDKLEAANLEVRMNLTDEKVILSLDSQKTYRIYENLFGNIAKYAMSGTRVYVNGFRIDDRVVITLKNISAQEITVDSAELTERFVRGDASRNTEGSGLGLAIAKSFAELQGGELSLEVDGDLFKVTTIWTLA